jgi:hypothetical protein
VPTLAEAEWKLASTLKTVPEWQWLMMLNYEYARCCEPVIKAVKLLREGKHDPSGNAMSPRPFARFLVKHYPEFPGTQWAQIEEKKRVERLELFGVTPETKFYFVEPAWEAWGFFEGYANLREELTDAAAESYGVFKIDFRQEDNVIAGKFREWLEDRRSPANLKAKEFKPGNAKGNTNGRTPINRKCEDNLKALGGLRALKYWGIPEEAETMTDGLYTDSHSWKRVEFQAGEMFTRLTTAWKHIARPFDPFANFDTHCIFPPHQLRMRFPSSDHIPKKRLAEVKKILAADFVVSALKTEVV